MKKLDIVKSLGRYDQKCDCCNGRNQPYMLTRELWREVCGKAGKSVNAFICLLCVERLLQRPLEENDFLLSAPINYAKCFGFDYKEWINAN